MLAHFTFPFPMAVGYHFMNIRLQIRKTDHCLIHVYICSDHSPLTEELPPAQIASQCSRFGIHIGPPSWSPSATGRCCSLGCRQRDSLWQAQRSPRVVGSTHFRMLLIGLGPEGSCADPTHRQADSIPVGKHVGVEAVDAVRVGREVLCQLWGRRGQGAPLSGQLGLLHHDPLLLTLGDMNEKAACS